MITYKEGNIFDARAEALVNTVNTVGVMGKGIALQFKYAFPENYKIYKAAAEKNEIVVGEVQVVPVNNLNSVKFIVNFPTKNHWRNPSKLQWIKDGLSDLHDKIYLFNIKSIALPPLGCGNGGLEWNVIKPVIEEFLSDLNIDIIVYEPTSFIKEALKKEERVIAAKLTPARAMLLSLLYQYRALGEFASEFAAVKLSYFLQRFGETQLKLKFIKGAYGPYANEVRFVLYTLNGYYLKGYEQMDTKPFETLELVSSKKSDVKNYLDSFASDAEKSRLNQITEFIQGFESPYKLELLATVDYSINSTNSFEPEVIKEEVKNWSLRKENLFTVAHIRLAIDHLKKYQAVLYN